MICYSFSNPLYFIFSSDVPALLYYSHVPTAVVAIVIGFFVFLSGRRYLINQLLFAISACFSLWVVSNLILWTNIHSDFMLFVWSFLRVLSSLISILSIYFIYVFLEKKDVSVLLKSIFLVLVIPIIALSPTYINLRGFDITSCDAFMFEGFLFQFSRIFFGILAMIWIFILLIRKYRKAEIAFRKQILLMGVGIELFLFSFFIVTFLAAYLTDMGILSDSRLEFYGLFGMTFFMGMLAYLIVKFKAFNIKLLGTQALVVSLAVVIGSQFAFIQNNTNKILTAISLILVIVFGWILVRSVKKEIKQKEALARANKSLALVNTKLEKIDATKTDFINIASHQLHKVPTPIKGYLSLLLEGSYGKITEEQKRVLENINSANNRQIDLVDDLLNVSRMESGKVNLDFKKQHLEDICQKVYDTTLPDAEEKGLKFSYKKPKDVLPELILDGGKIFEAIFNFVDNAIKYTSKGKVDLAIEFDPKSRYKLPEGDDEKNAPISSSVVRVTVADTGAGIAKENVPYLFAKFSRKDTANLNTEGTGLGLYVVKLMIEAHGGRTWAESAGEGKGSQFIIEIPTKQPKNIVVK